MTVDANMILEGLTVPQRQAVTHIDGPLLVLAGAGSGKTRTITRRIAYLVANGIPPWNILAVTFTNKAAGEMRNRTLQLLQALPTQLSRGITVATFHSLCARLLRQYAPVAGLDANFNIMDTSDQLKLVKHAMEKAGISIEALKPDRVLSVISDAKSKLKSAEAFAKTATMFNDRNIARVYMAYEQLMHEHKTVDFDDLLFKMAVLLRDHAEVRDELQERFRYILIDEYQDTNHAQFVISHMLAMRHKNICVTGDPDQSIYGWRGANLSNILEFEQFFPNARVVLLEQNYRSTKIILKAASALISNNIVRKNKDLWTENEAGQKILHLVCGDERQEAQELVRKLKELHEQQHFGWENIAIMYRLNALTRVLEDALMKAGVPYQIVRGTEFYGRKEVKDVLAYLRLIIAPEDNISVERVINVPARSIGSTSLERLAGYAHEHHLALMQVCRQDDTIEGLPKRAAEGCRKFATMIDSWRQRFAPAKAVSAAGVAQLEDIDPGAMDDADFAGADSPIDDTGSVENGASSEPTSDPLYDPAFSTTVTDDNSREDYNLDAAGRFKTPDMGENTALSSPNLSGSVAIPVVEILETVIEESGLKLVKSGSAEDDEQRKANILELVNVAAEFDRQNPGGTLQDYLTQVTLVSDADRMREQNTAVTLMTLHAAKGLEFPVVAIVGLEDGLIPHQRMFGDRHADMNIEEERRLAFVGITRAMKHLILTRAAYRTVMGHSDARNPSRFLKEIPDDCLEVMDLTMRERSAESFGFRNNVSDQFARPWSDALTRAEPKPVTELSTGGKPCWRCGTLVRHRQFGLGRIENIDDVGGDYRAVINFQGSGRRTLLLSFAKLETVDG
ncbi:MAG: UvrD-helicase domain-containing protein [Planctomycetia bacterium]|nr:UvrD-helicase domain-containing protein [Planctomycetia bacterium]